MSFVLQELETRRPFRGVGEAFGQGVTQGIEQSVIDQVLQQAQGQADGGQGDFLSNLLGGLAQSSLAPARQQQVANLIVPTLQKREQDQAKAAQQQQEAQGLANALKTLNRQKPLGLDDEQLEQLAASDPKAARQILTNQFVPATFAPPEQTAVIALNKDLVSTIRDKGQAAQQSIEALGDIDKIMQAKEVGVFSSLPATIRFLTGKEIPDNANEAELRAAAIPLFKTMKGVFGGNLNQQEFMEIIRSLVSPNKTAEANAATVQALLRASQPDFIRNEVLNEIFQEDSAALANPNLNSMVQTRVLERQNAAKQLVAESIGKKFVVTLDEPLRPGEVVIQNSKGELKAIQKKNLKKIPPDWKQVDYKVKGQKGKK